MNTFNGYRVLVVDSDLHLIQSILKGLQLEGFEVESALSGKGALKMFRKFKPNIVIMDLALSDIDGIEVCTEIRTSKLAGNTMIIINTNHHEDYSQLAGFAAGADDYIIKPVKFKILLMRIKALLKRLDSTFGNEKIPESKEGIVIDRERYLVLKDGKEIVCPRKEFELLSLLYNSPRKVFTRHEISNSIWGFEIDPKNRTIDVHIGKLREKLGYRYIKTVKGIGYSFEF